ncbi:MAG TPA: tetratricopeptide repeat protein [Pyrinomonadaceae bacterium]|jgi:tetratricopeptide (TPR) repeat protein
MEFFYNPDLMSEADIKATFVARQSLVDELVNLIKRQPDGAGVQHVVILAPRGMGKTTMLLIIQFAVKDRGLAEQWQVVRFPEESYNIYDLSDFWIQILQHLATDTKDNELQQQIEKLPSEYPNNEDLQEVTYALIKDWRRKNKKRILVLVDNFDQILQQINDERDNARLRDVLMNDGAIMLIGGATTFFHEARAYDQPLYNFFKIENLNDLSFEQMEELLIRRAELDGRKDFDKVLEKQRPKLRALEFFSGGNPRLVLMLYRVITSTKMNDVMNGLEKLLDEVTPYYKAKVEALPPQQRKILDLIARESSRTNEGLTPGEIAKQTRLSPNQASAQLKRLVETGHIRAANLRGRNTYYTLSEKLYAIWHQMRFGRNRREKLQWLVNALNAIFSLRELSAATTRLATVFQEHFVKGKFKDARDTLEHQFLLAEAMPSSEVRSETMHKIICGYVEIKDFASLKEYLAPEILRNLSFKSLGTLIENDCISVNDLENCLTIQLSSSDKVRYPLNVLLGSKAFKEGKIEEALEHFNEALEIKPDSKAGWGVRGSLLIQLGNFSEAAKSFETALRNGYENYQVWTEYGDALLELNQFKDAILKYNRALKLNPKHIDAWLGLADAFYELKKYEKAVNYCDKALEIDPNHVGALHNRGIALGLLGRHEQALDSFSHALKINHENTDSWYGKAVALLFIFFQQTDDRSFDNAKHTWKEFVISAKKGNGLQQILSKEFVYLSMIAIIKSAGVEYVKELINELGEYNPFYALERAIDYIQTNDETLIEKLSPEVRGVVEETIRFLQEKPANENQTSKKTNKQKRNSRVNKKANQKSLPDSRAEKKTS